MNKYEKETEKVLLDHEKKAYNDLKATYTNALKDIKLRIRDLQADIDLLKMTEGDEDAKNRVQSKVYQLEYQKALEGQINAILEVVKQDNIKTTQTFLTKMYEDSYLAINYNLQKRGIPVIMPINNKLIVDVINMPTEDLKFSERLYTQVNHLKKTVKAEISRGIATGQSYGKIAQQVSLLTEADLNKSYRIVRTEGGRVSSEAKLQSMQEAKARGCDIVKQWDATLDNATRDVHQQLDGQWVEVDEYFKASGYKTKRPHGFGMASQDINCRCVLLSVPRWDLEDTVEKLDNITGEIITAKNYADWKQKYYSVVNDYKEVEKVKTIQDINTEVINILKKTYEKVRTENNLNLVEVDKLDDQFLKVDFGNVDTKLAQDLTNQLGELTSKYNSTPIIEIKQTTLKDPLGNYDKGVIARTELKTSVSQGSIFFQDNLTDYEEYIERIKKDVSSKYIPNIKEEDYTKYVITHEFAHTFSLVDKVRIGYDYTNWVNQDMKSLKEFDDSIKTLFNEYTKELKDIDKELKDYTNKLLFGTLTKEDEARVSELNAKYDELLISKYSLVNVDEFMAEGFTDGELGINPAKYSIKVHDLIKKHFGG